MLMEITDTTAFNADIKSAVLTEGQQAVITLSDGSTVTAKGPATVMTPVDYTLQIGTPDEVKQEVTAALDRKIAMPPIRKQVIDGPQTVTK
jgi:hypothetical protein